MSWKEIISLSGSDGWFSFKAYGSCTCGMLCIGNKCYLSFSLSMGIAANIPPKHTVAVHVRYHKPEGDTHSLSAAVTDNMPSKHIVAAHVKYRELEGDAHRSIR